jgi:hypothetical protein
MYRIVVSALPGDSNEIFGSKASALLGNATGHRHRSLAHAIPVE